MRKYLVLLLLAALLLSGCAMQTLDELYCLPKRSDAYKHLQAAIDSAIGDREYCAPLSGENLQAVQMVDLDGDGVEEHLLFAKADAAKPLQILIFRRSGEEYVLAEIISNAGSAFDVVEYARIDDRPGYELIVGHRVNDQAVKSVSVYSFPGNGRAKQLLTAEYTNFLTYDLNADGRSELMVMHPGESEIDNGLAELYQYSGGTMERSEHVKMSQPANRLKRIITGQLADGQPAVYAASSVDESAIITDVFALVEGVFTNVTFSNETDTSVQTLRDYYVFADDINNDGVVELPDLITMRPPSGMTVSDQQYLIRWFAMTATGKEIDCGYTYHNFQGGWYVELNGRWAPRATVIQTGSSYEFYCWDEAFTTAEKIMTIYVLTGPDREEWATRDNRFTVYKGENVLYAAKLEAVSASYGITQNRLFGSFHLIRQDWKTGET